MNGGRDGSVVGVIDRIARRKMQEFSSAGSSLNLFTYTGIVAVIYIKV